MSQEDYSSKEGSLTAAVQALARANYHIVRFYVEGKITMRDAQEATNMAEESVEQVAGMIKQEMEAREND